jgi:hypothetical protein
MPAALAVPSIYTTRYFVADGGLMCALGYTEGRDFEMTRHIGHIATSRDIQANSLWSTRSYGNAKACTPWEIQER